MSLAFAMALTSTACYCLARTAILVALLSSALCCGLLLMVQDPLLQFLGLDAELRSMAEGYYTLRAASLPLVFLYRVTQGVLTGFNRINAVCFVSCLGAGVEVLGAYLCLTVRLLHCSISS